MYETIKQCFKKSILKKWRLLFQEELVPYWRWRIVTTRDQKGSRRTGPAGLSPDHSAPPVPTFVRSHVYTAVPASCDLSIKWDPVPWILHLKAPVPCDSMTKWFRVAFSLVNLPFAISMSGILMVGHLEHLEQKNQCQIGSFMGGASGLAFMWKAGQVRILPIKLHLHGQVLLKNYMGDQAC